MACDVAWASCPWAVTGGTPVPLRYSFLSLHFEGVGVYKFVIVMSRSPPRTLEGVAITCATSGGLPSGSGPVATVNPLLVDRGFVHFESKVGRSSGFEVRGFSA